MLAKYNRAQINQRFIQQLSKAKLQNTNPLNIDKNVNLILREFICVIKQRFKIFFKSVAIPNLGSVCLSVHNRQLYFSLIQAFYNCPIGWVHIGIGMCGYMKQIKKAIKTFLAKIKFKINDFQTYIIRFSLLKNRFEKQRPTTTFNFDNQQCTFIIYTIYYFN